MPKRTKIRKVRLASTSSNNAKLTKLGESEIIEGTTVSEMTKLEKYDGVDPSSKTQTSLGTQLSESDTASKRKSIYSGLNGTVYSRKSTCPMNTTTTTAEIGPYKWKVSWLIIDCSNPDGPSTSSSPQRKLVIEVLKLSDYIYNWKLQFGLEFQDKQQQPIRRIFDVTETHKTQKCEVKEFKDVDLAKTCMNSPVTIRWISTETPHIWKHCATEVNLEDPNRAHDFILVASDKRKSTHDAQERKEKKFYVHLSYLRAWSGYFQKLIEPSSPYVLEEDPETVSALLTLFHPNMADVLNDDNIVKVMYLANKLEVPNVVNRLAEILCDSENYPRVTMIHRLHVGETLKIRKLMIESLREIEAQSKRKQRRWVKDDLYFVNGLSKTAMAELLIALTTDVNLDDDDNFDDKILNQIKLPRLYESTPRSECDRSLLLGENKIPVNSSVLATWSPFFDELFFNNPETMHVNVLSLDNVSPNIFHIILKLIQTKTGEVLSNSTVYEVLEIATELGMASVIAMCGTYITKKGWTGNSGEMAFLDLAVHVNSIDLIDAALKNIENMEDRQLFVKDNLNNISNLPEAIRNNVMIAVSAKQKRSKRHSETSDEDDSTNVNNSSIKDLLNIFQSTFK